MFRIRCMFYVHSPSFSTQYLGAMGSERMRIVLSRSLCRWKRRMAILAGLSGFVHSLSATAAALGHMRASGIRLLFNAKRETEPQHCRKHTQIILIDQLCPDARFAAEYAGIQGQAVLIDLLPLIVRRAAPESMIEIPCILCRHDELVAALKQLPRQFVGRIDPRLDNVPILIQIVLNVFNVRQAARPQDRFAWRIARLPSTAWILSALFVPDTQRGLLIFSPQLDEVLLLATESAFVHPIDYLLRRVPATEMNLFSVVVAVGKNANVNLSGPNDFALTSSPPI